jgi:two-component system CheB/CheR fusion protein
VPEGFRSLIEMIYRNVAAEARLIDDLLDVTRILRGKMRLEQQPTDLHQVARQSVETLSVDIEAKRHQVTLALEADRHHVRGEAMRLGQVLSNLLRNAVKFTPPGGHIELRSWNHEGRIALEVSDDGVGFAPQDRDRLFSAFEQAGDGGGLGLGLAICKGLVELHGGELSAASPGRGRGARFVVQFVTVDVPAVVAPPSAPAAPAAEDKPRILLVEDHPDTAAALAELLADRGFQVLTANTVRSALEVDLDGVDLVLSDIGLPDATGTDLIRELKRKRAIKGIALSGYGTEADVQASKDAGFSAHLVKPVDLDELLAAIDEVNAAHR